MSEATAALLGDNGGAGAGAATPPGGAPAAPPPPAWHGLADPDASAYIQNKGWQSPADIYSSYRNLEKFAGGSKSLVEMPGPDATPEQISQFYDKLGRPADPKGYELSVPEGGDADLVEWFTKTAHAHGLRPEQAKGLFNEWNQMTQARAAGMEDNLRVESEQQINALKREWGAQYQANIDAGRRAAAGLGYDQNALTAMENKLGTAEMLKLFSTIGAKMGEPSFEGSGRSGDAGGFGTTAASAKQQLEDLKSDQAFMKGYLEGRPDHVAKMTRLMGIAHGGA